MQTRYIKLNKFSKLEKLVKREDLSTNEIIELLASHDTLTKKLTCNYLVDRSASDSDLGLLTANLLIKDCNDANPSIRSASLLALSSLPAMEEASINVLHKCMADASVQVRRTCPHACTQLHKLNPEAFVESGLIDRLYEGIRDSDPIALMNCLVALDTVLISEGGVIINKNIAHHLFGRLNCFSNCSLVYIINVLMHYIPKSEEEVFGLLNQIDFCLTSSVPSVVISSTKLFMHLSKGFEHLIPDMLETIKVPVCKIISQSNPENCHLLLEYLESLKIDLKDHFGSLYKFFVLRAKDPTYMKCKKLEFLPLIATEDNVADIVSEVKHYTADYQSFKAAFECLAILGTVTDDALVQILIILTPLLKSSNEQIVASALKCLLSVVSLPVEDTASRSKELGSFITDSLVKNINFIINESNFQENNPLLLLHVLTIFAPFLKNTQECFQNFCKNYDSYDDETQCQLIKATAVVFLSWPAALQPVLSSILSKGFSSATESSVPRQATFIYASLELGVKEASHLLSVGPFKPRILEFV